MDQVAKQTLDALQRDVGVKPTTTGSGQTRAGSSGSSTLSLKAAAIHHTHARFILLIRWAFQPLELPPVRPVIFPWPPRILCAGSSGFGKCFICRRVCGCR